MDLVQYCGFYYKLFSEPHAQEYYSCSKITRNNVIDIMSKSCGFCKNNPKIVNFKDHCSCPITSCPITNNNIIIIFKDYFFKASHGQKS